MDGRTALAAGTVLRLSTHTGYTEYTVRREIGRGGSCIVYDASCTDNLGNHKLVRIKECYPHILKISRNEDGSLRADDRDRMSFEAAKARITDAYQKNHTLFVMDALTNTIANTPNLYTANGTIYIVSAWLNGQTFLDHQGDTLHDCISLILSTAKVLRSIHDAGYLYLDLKPENILTIKGSLDLVQLFDFDSMVAMRDLQHAIQANDSTSIGTSYTKGYASLEQQTGKLRQLGRQSDLYSLGAVLFYALWHRAPSAFDCADGAAYEYAQTVYASEHHQDGLFRALTAFFRRTLASYHADRYQDASEAIEQLNTILALSDEMRIWLRSTVIKQNAPFYGRKKEMTDLAALLAGAGHGIVSLYGMGGIGKSSLVRAYLRAHGDDWDAVLWMYDQERFDDFITDDALVSLSTIHRIPEESTEAYLRRKTAALQSLTSEQRVLLVLDNFTLEHLDQLSGLSQVGWTILLISRERLPEGMFPALRVAELEEQALKLLFETYSRCTLHDEDDLKCVRAILSAIRNHTLLAELIARQISKSYLDIRVAETMVTGIGLADLPDEKIDYVRDQSACHDTLLRILDRLVEIDHFTEQEKLCMKLLSLFDAPGIEARLFAYLADLPKLDFVNDLETSGWLKADGAMLCFHPMMQEYISAWVWAKPMVQAADIMMKRLYDRIRPTGTRHDGSKQFPDDYEALYGLLKVADQMLGHIPWVSEASQRLLFRMITDLPVDQDASVMYRMLNLLQNPKYLDSDSILRLYENAAYFRARLYAPEEAIRILDDMKRYLHMHPSAYYLSAYHRAMAVILHNADEHGTLKRCLWHENMAIAACRVSSHPEAKEQLVSCLLDKATALLSADLNRKQARRLIAEAKRLVAQSAHKTDYVRYQYVCVAAMCCAMDGDFDSAEVLLTAADEIVFASPDSDLAVAEHLIEQVAPIRMTMEQYPRAAEAILQAISLCEKHEEAIRYRETRFDAYLFLGKIFEMNRQYIKSEEAFHEAEKRVDDSPYEWELPLCPDHVKAKADEERRKTH